MNNMSLLIYSLIMLFGVFISSVAQVFLKKASMRKYSSIIREYLNFPVIASYSIFILATLCNIYAYKVVPLSMGPILEATSYIYVSIFGVLIFKERLNISKIVALVCILCGIALCYLG